MREIVFWGATGQAKVLYELIEGSDLELIALIDNRLVPSPMPNVPILLSQEGLKVWLNSKDRTNPLYYAVAIGGNKGLDRLMLMEVLSNLGLVPLTLIHRTAFVAANVGLGDGCQILAQSAVCTNVILGHGVIVNTGASIDHDCQIGDGAHIGPGARLAGEVIVGERAFIGIGAVVLPRITIGDDAIVGAGAVVTRNVASKMTVMGNPARTQNFGNQGQK